MSSSAVLFERVGIAAVIVSLVFVGFEIRQNTSTVRSSTIQALSEQSFGAAALFLESADAREAFIAYSAEQELTLDQDLALRTYYAALLRIQQNRFIQSKLGILDEETLLDLGGRGGMYESPYFREYWGSVAQDYPDDFRAWIERVLLLQSGS